HAERAPISERLCGTRQGGSSLYTNSFPDHHIDGFEPDSIFGIDVESILFGEDDIEA
ncbi:hypothetical protein Pmar_PMAR028204, partial [Perkinsus marinus ATCC 50983]